jgi:alpha-glucosidase
VSLPWWKTAVVYQIYPRSFADSNGDGVGDLPGVRARLEHLSWLGVDAIWLSPFYPSPMADFGYDVADYCDVDPIFGTLDDFDALLSDAHERGIRVLIDWVPNHTSDQHPWFVESRSSRDNPKRDWYIWRDGPPDRPPSDWKAAFGGDAWTYDDETNQWYLHLFLPQQPDLNWRNPDVVDAMHATLRFWLDRGVDGFRVDVVHGLVKHREFPDLGEVRADRTDRFDEPAVHAVVRDLRVLLDSYPGDRMMVGEVYILSTAVVARYYGDSDELHLAFNFPPLYAPWDAAAWRKRVNRVVEEFDPVDAWPTWVLSNHDNPRHRTRYGGSEARSRAAAVLLLTLRGTPFLYAGEEFGLEDAHIPPARVVDPGGRDGCRAPIPWDGTRSHGWGSAAPWLPWPPDAGTRNADALRADSDSILHLYRRLLATRAASPALLAGAFDWRDAPEQVLAYERSGGGDRRMVLVSFANAPLAAPVDGSWIVEVASDQVTSDGAGEGQAYAGSLGPDSAVVLRPA